ncbi:MAG: glucokinase [Chlamydiae bacterium]|nr:glucokinase [Chlamydiota bacterium]
MVLVGDIGGTHTRLAFFENGRKLIEQKYLSKNFQSLEAIVQDFLQSEKRKPGKACFGVPGAVREGKCKATNLPWMIDEMSLSETLKIPKVKLINDLEAHAHSLQKLGHEDLFLLQKGDPAQKGNRALMAAGTGLGEAGLVWDGETYHPFASEGGHADFAARNEEEMELFFYLQKKFGHVAYERVLSGPGLYSIFEFLIEKKGAILTEEVKREMQKKDPASVVSVWGCNQKDATCSLALDLFVSVYGAEAGNLALKFFALGGFFVGGGIAPHILERIKTGPFLNSFCSKGRFQKFLESIPVWIILNDDTALIGAEAYLERL